MAGKGETTTNKISINSPNVPECPHVAAALVGTTTVESGRTKIIVTI